MTLGEELPGSPTHCSATDKGNVVAQKVRSRAERSKKTRKVEQPERGKEEKMGTLVGKKKMGSRNQAMLEGGGACEGHAMITWTLTY
jgi:hypothetical protein